MATDPSTAGPDSDQGGAGQYSEWRVAWIIFVVNFFFSATFSVLNATIPDISHEFSASAS